jgi:hypothetical protein
VPSSGDHRLSKQAFENFGEELEQSVDRKRLRVIAAVFVRLFDEVWLPG